MLEGHRPRSRPRGRNDGQLHSVACVILFAVSDPVPLLVGLRNVVPVIGCTFTEGVTEEGDPVLIIG